MLRQYYGGHSFRHCKGATIPAPDRMRSLKFRRQFKGSRGLRRAEPKTAGVRSLIDASRSYFHTGYVWTRPSKIGSGVWTISGGNVSNPRIADGAGPDCSRPAAEAMRRVGWRRAALEPARSRIPRRNQDAAERRRSKSNAVVIRKGEIKTAHVAKVSLFVEQHDRDEDENQDEPQRAVGSRRGYRSPRGRRPACAR